MPIVLISSGMRAKDTGFYSDKNGTNIIFLNEGDIVPTIDGELQILKIKIQ